MTKPKLSICVITYNRAKYLKKTLAHLSFLKTFPFDCEVLVSDNCSTDETSAVAAGFMKKFDRIRYIKQTRNVGPERNLISAFRMAAGEFVVYLADDDMLIPDAVVAIVRYMEANSNIAVCHAPWEHWDDVTKQSLGLFYRIEKETIFQKKDSVDLFNFIIQKHIFPEICIYRSDALHKMLYLSHKAFWPFVNLARLLDYGDIAFLPEPFYRSVTKHWEGETRSQHGHQQAMLEWDLYRGGVEYLFHKAFRNLGHPAVPEDQRDIGRKMIDIFVATRLSVALRQLIGKKDFISANDVFIRLLSCRTLPEAETSHYGQFLAPRAAVQSMIETFEAITRLECIGLYHVSDSDAVTTLFKEIRPDLPIRVLSDGAINKIKNKDTVLILAGSDLERKKLIEAGFGNGLVIVEQELVSQFMA